MASKLTDVFCTYTGGHIYVCTARYADVWLSTDFEMYGTYDVPYDDIETKYDYDYDGHMKTPAEPLPTWGELLEAIRSSYEDGVSLNVDMGEVESQIRYLHPDLSRRLDEEDSPAPAADRSDRLETICEFIEAFEEFLDEKGIVIPNDEKEQDPESASNIYGTDYGILSDKIEALLIRYGVLKGE